MTTRSAALSGEQPCAEGQVKSGGGLRLVALREFRKMMGGLSCRRAYDLSKRADFPQPVAQLRLGRVWDAEDVATWIANQNVNVTPGDASEGGD
jgi:prophage regulatory protein